MKIFFEKIRSIALVSMLAAAVNVSGAAEAKYELNFKEIQIDALAATISTMMGKNVVVDPKVKGSITLTSDVPVTAKQALAQIHAALRMQGYVLVDSGAVIMVVPEVQGKFNATRVGGAGSGSEIVTRVFNLNHENAVNVLGVVKPLVTPNNVINVNPGTNAIVVTDYADNVQRIGHLISSLDVSKTPDLEIIPLEHAIASELVPLVQRLLDSGIQSLAVKDASGMALQSTLLADSRSNSLIVRAANAAKLAQIKSLVMRLDQPAIQRDSSMGNLHVVHLRHADAVALAEVLRAAIKTIEQSAPVVLANTGMALATAGTTAAAATGTAMQAASGGASAAGGLSSTTPLNLGQVQMPSVGGLVQADPNTNSLIITAPAPMYRQLRAVIDRLDTRRAQVLVEAMIVEVSDNKLAEFGVQWQAAVGKNGSTLGAIGTNSGVAGPNILNVAAGLASGDAAGVAGALSSLGSGFNLALAPKALGQYYLGALANFLQKDGDTNVLSKPNLMTVDNQEARIVIGANVPFVTGSYATTGGNSTVNPFTTVERKDVGLMLSVKPQINENGTVKLVVKQEASNIDPGTINNANGPSTTKRSIESTVLVEDGSIIMIGGLLQDSFSMNVDKVPLLGDVPVFGNLFRSQNRSRTKSNLMVFLRPVVLRDGHATHAFSVDRYEEMRAQQAVVQPSASLVMGNINAAPVAPALQPAVLIKEPETVSVKGD